MTENFKRAVKLLVNNNYKRICVVLPSYTVGKLIPEIFEDTVNGGKYFRSANKFTRDDLTIFFYSSLSPERLRGMQFDAALVLGDSNSACKETLKFCTRLGENPVVLQVE